MEKANELKRRLQKSATTLVKCDLIKPAMTRKSLSDKQFQENLSNYEIDPNLPRSVEIENVPLLNPKLSKQKRQKNMAFVLMPFGFIAGLTFSQMTGLTTFADLGMNFLDERVTGGLVGMASGWMGSYVGAASVKSKNIEDISSLRKLSEDGLWLLLLETPFEIELPWSIVQTIEPIEVVRLLEE